MSGKTIAIISYITIVGWIVALVINSSERDYFASFHIRQSLGIFIMGAVSAIPVIGWLLGIGAFVFWIIGFVSALNGRTVPVPFIGDHFQNWFRGL